MISAEEKIKLKGNQIGRLELDPEGETFSFICCECKLTHSFSLALEDNGKIGVAIQYNKKLTKQNREQK